MCVGGPSTVEVTSETSLSSLPALMSGFLSKLEEARRVVGEPNFIGPQAAKAFLEDDPSALLLDVQDPGSEVLPGAYNVSLGTLFFKASSDLEEFKDATIADRPRDSLIIVTCMYGGQAALAAQLLCEYGYANVKVMQGGNEDARKTYSDNRLWKWVALQREIFEAALKYVKDSGKIVYATCSVLEEENAQQIRFFCEKFGLYLSHPPLHARPQSRGMDGFFCATLERRPGVPVRFKNRVLDGNHTCLGSCWARACCCHSQEHLHCVFELLVCALPCMVTLHQCWDSREMESGWNPFMRADRRSFPVITELMWQCKAGTPPDSKSRHSSPIPTEWLAAGEELSWHRGAEHPRRADEFLADRQRRGLITPAKTPSDILKRGPLFDPDSDGRSPLISEMSSSSFLGSSGCRAWPIQGPTMSRSTARVSDHSSRRPVPLWTDLKAATEPSRAAKPLASWALAEASTRESEAFSVATSISFGREDPRVCDASMPAAAAAQPGASRVCSLGKSTLPGVARQLDFDGVGVFAEPDHSPLSSVDAWHSRTSSLSSLDELRETCNTKPASCEVQSVRPANAKREMPDKAASRFVQYRCDEHRRSLQLGGRTGRW
eukprot:s367_g19.t3